MENSNHEKKSLQSAVIKVVLIGLLVFLIFGNNLEIFYSDYFEKDEISSNEKEYSNDAEQEPEEEEFVEDNSEEVFSVVDLMPRFDGCQSKSEEKAEQCTMEQIQRYTAQVNYPQIAIDNDIEGKIYISFVVNSFGYVSEVTLKRGIDDLLDNAALEHIKKMPKFAEPGYQGGKAVKVQYIVPIVFKLS